VAQLVARFNVTAHGARTSRSQQRPSAQTGPKLSAGGCRTGPQVSIATGSHSLAIGQRFRVNASTVGKALRRAEVQLRPRRGWASGK